LQKAGVHAGNFHARTVVVCGARSAQNRLERPIIRLMAMGEPIIDGSRLAEMIQKRGRRPAYHQ
jgi:hypothetical protein